MPRNRPANRTMPAKDETGRQWPPPSQPKAPIQRPPQAATIRSAKLHRRSGYSR